MIRSESSTVLEYQFDGVWNSPSFVSTIHEYVPTTTALFARTLLMRYVYTLSSSKSKANANEAKVGPRVDQPGNWS